MVETGQWDFPTLAADHFNDWGTFAIPLRSPSDHPAVPLGGEVWTVPKTNSAGGAGRVELPRMGPDAFHRVDVR